MTIIAYKCGIMAADSATIYGGTLLGAAKKIARNAKGDLAGASGDAVYSHAFLEWFVGGEKKNRPNAVDREKPGDSNRGLIIRKGGAIEVYEFDQVYHLTAPYFAIGSGSCEALGAMFAGADPVTAVRAAIAHDSACGGEVVVLSHIETKPFTTTATGIPFQ